MSFKGSAPWVQAFMSQLTKSSILKSVLSSSSSPHANVVSCMGYTPRIHDGCPPDERLCATYTTVFGRSQDLRVGHSGRNLVDDGSMMDGCGSLNRAGSVNDVQAAAGILTSRA